MKGPLEHEEKTIDDQEVAETLNSGNYDAHADELIYDWHKRISTIQGIGNPMQETRRIIENEDLKFSEEFPEIKTFIDRIEPIFDEKVGQEEGNDFLQAKEVQLNSKIVGYGKVIEKMKELSSSIDNAYNGLPDSSVFYGTIEGGRKSLEDRLNELVPTKSWFYYLRPQLWRENLKKKNLKEELYGRLGYLDELGKDYLNISKEAKTKKEIIKKEIANARIMNIRYRGEIRYWHNREKKESVASKDIQNDNDADDIIEVSSNQTMSVPPSLPLRSQSNDGKGMDPSGAQPDAEVAVAATIDVRASKKDNVARPLPPLPPTGENGTQRNNIDSLP
ncbi:hypothetical protein V1387_18365, partial [Allomuricauda taeanensis]|uniref:hypothetical protein n=1 Tax=Flagellimonas taeanensis TaxID=1005926 RepID=UPI002E7C5333